MNEILFEIDLMFLRLSRYGIYETPSGMKALKALLSVRKFYEKKLSSDQTKQACEAV